MGTRTAVRPRAAGQRRPLRTILHRSGSRVPTGGADVAATPDSAGDLVDAYLHPEEVTYALASMPGRTPEAWTAEERRFWAVTVVPGAEAHARLATGLAAQCGTRTVQERTVAATHILMTLTLGSPATPRHRVRPAILHSAYDLLEAALPAAVRQAMPARLVRTRGLASPLQRRLLAAALVGAAAAVGLAEVSLVQALLR